MPLVKSGAALPQSHAPNPPVQRLHRPQVDRSASARAPSNCFFGDTAPRRASCDASDSFASPSEKPAQPHKPPGRWNLHLPRMALAVYVVVTFAPVVGCAVLSGLALAGILAPVPALMIAVGLLCVTVLGTLITKWLEDWESRPRPTDQLQHSDSAS